MELASCLQRLGVQQSTHPDYHVMLLEYPATHLIPDSPQIGLRMEPPKAAMYRETSDLDKYFLHEQGLEYCVRYQVTNCQTRKTTGSHVADLSAAVSQLSNRGGRSILEAVTVSDSDNGEGGYIFRLTTHWHAGGPSEVDDFQVGGAEWRDLSASDSSQSWSYLLRDLVSRASDRAFLHVQRQLCGSDYSGIGALKWDCCEIRTANQLLAINMREVQQQSDFLCLLPIRDFYGDPHRILTVRLPCDHETTISLHGLKSLSRAECIDMECPNYGRTIMPGRAITEAHHNIERRRRQRKHLDEILWRRIEYETSECLARISTSGALLCIALGHALRSLRVSESVSPRALCPAWSAEASSILAGTTASLGNPATSQNAFESTAECIVKQLMRFVDTILQQKFGLRNDDMTHCLFPGWTVFCQCWIERTVKLAAVPGYDGQDVWDIYDEVPDEDICVDMGDGIVGGDVDLGTLMGEVSLL